MGQLEDMDAFVRIIDAGSISNAAGQLGVVKSAVSRRLVDLELRLGVQLLHRTTRKSNLTEAGRQYYERSVQILADVAEINATTSNAQVALKGRLKISVPVSFGLLHLTKIINEFAHLHPDLVVHMDFNDRQVNLVEEGYDLAIRIANLKNSSLIASKLAPIKFILCASPDYLAVKGTPKAPLDLKGHNILHYANTQSTAWHLIGPEGRAHTVPFSAKIVSNNGDFLKESAKEGNGIILAPTFIAWKEIASGQLVPVMEDYRCPELNAYGIYPQTRHLPHRVRTLMDFLKNKFSGGPYWDKTAIVPDK